MKKLIFDNLPYKVLSVLIALGLWFIVRDQRVEFQLRIPLEVTAPDELVVTSEPPHSISLSVVSPRFALDKLRKLESTPYAIFLDATEPGPTEVLVQTQDLRIPNEVSIQEIRPNRFEVLLERKAKEDFQIRPRLLGLPAAGYTVGKPKIEPERVEVVGATSLIRDLQWVYTEPISIEGRTETFTGEYQLSLPASQVWLADPRPVRVTVPILPVATPEPGPTPAEGEGEGDEGEGGEVPPQTQTPAP